LTDNGASKDDRRRRVLHYILEVWSLDENSEPVFHDYQFPDKEFERTEEKGDIHVNQVWPNLEPVDGSISFENDWKQDIVGKYVFVNDPVKSTDGKSYTSNLSGKKFSDLVETLWQESVWGIKLIVKDKNTIYYKNNRTKLLSTKNAAKCSLMREPRSRSHLADWWKTYAQLVKSNWF